VFSFAKVPTDLMELYQITYYSGLLLALLLCWNLGPLFYTYILFQISTDVLLDIGWLAQGDMRLKWAMIEWLDCIWILMLANIFRSRFESFVISGLVLIAFSFGIYPSLTEAADSWPRWVELTTEIMRGWAVINLAIIVFAVSKTVYLWKVEHQPNDLVVNPRRRFLLPLGAFFAILAMPMEWIPWHRAWIEAHRFPIAAHVMAWGWVVAEFKFFLQAWRWRRKYGKE
jgi:hypothetical protein